MPVFKRATLSEKTLQAQTLLNNALNNPEILKALTGFNYPAEKLQGYQTGYARLDELIQKQKTEYSEQHEATRIFETAADLADDKYIFNLKLARVIFKNNDKAKEALVLNGSRKRSFTGWFTDADTFYKTVLNNPEYLKEFQN